MATNKAMLARIIKDNPLCADCGTKGTSNQLKTPNIPPTDRQIDR